MGGLAIPYITSNIALHKPEQKAGEREIGRVWEILTSTHDPRTPQPRKRPSWQQGQERRVAGRPIIRRRPSYSCWARTTSGVLVSTESAETYITWQETWLHAWANWGSCWRSRHPLSRLLQIAANPVGATFMISLREAQSSELMVDARHALI